MNKMASQITSLTIVYSNVYSGTDQRKHQKSTQLAFVWGIHRWPVNSLHKRPVTWKMFLFDGVIVMYTNRMSLEPQVKFHSQIWIFKWFQDNCLDWCIKEQTRRMDPGGRLNKKDSLTRYGDSFCPANERWRYFVTTFLSGWVQT